MKIKKITTTNFPVIDSTVNVLIVINAIIPKRTTSSSKTMKLVLVYNPQTPHVQAKYSFNQNSDTNSNQCYTLIKM